MINLQVQKDILLNQVKQVEALENILANYNLTLHTNSVFMFDSMLALVVDLDNGDQLKITKELTIKIRLYRVDTFVNFYVVQACNKEQKVQLIKCLEGIDWEYTLENLTVSEYAKEVTNLENYYINLLDNA